MPFRAVAATTGFALLLLTGGCHQIKVKTEGDAAADFSARKTYAWGHGAGLDTGDPRFDSPQMQTHIRSVVETILAAKGFTKAEAGDPDFVIEYAANIGVASSTITRRGHSDSGMQDWRWTGTTTDDYEKGTLVMRMAEPTTGRSLWRAVASGVLRDQADAAERREGMGKVLRKMLRQFPPEP